MQGYLANSKACQRQEQRQQQAQYIHQSRLSRKCFHKRLGQNALNFGEMNEQRSVFASAFNFRQKSLESRNERICRMVCRKSLSGKKAHPFSFFVFVESGLERALSTQNSSAFRRKNGAKKHPQPKKKRKKKKKKKKPKKQKEKQPKRKIQNHANFAEKTSQQNVRNKRKQQRKTTKKEKKTIFLFASSFCKSSSSSIAMGSSMFG